MLYLNILKTAEELVQYDIYFAGYIKGLEKIWILGDEFANETVEQHFKGIKDEHCKFATFTYDSYEVREYVSSKHTSHIRSVIARTRNNLIRAINDQGALRKLIVMVQDDDIIKYLEGETAEDVKIQIRPIMKWLVREIEKAILAFKDFLPNKAKRHHQPHVLWMKPPVHTNFGNSWNMLREEVGVALREVTESKINMSCLPMLKIWDPEDQNAFRYESYRFTSEGLRKYWLSIDSAIKFWCTAISTKIAKNMAKSHNSNSKPKAQSAYHNNSRFSWRKSARSDYRRMPTPP